MVQREVALRIARDKKESILSLSVKVFGNPRYVKTIKPGNFIPPPKVDSAILAVTHISHERLRGADESAFFTILHAGFASKRKQLFGNLSKIFPREQLEHIFHTLGFEKKVRGEDLTLPEWVSLTHELSPLFSPK